MLQQVKCFQQNELVITHFADPTRCGTQVPVSGVVVRPGTIETTIKIRDKAGHTKEITLPNDLLSSR
jgi:hypothetical protein